MLLASPILSQSDPNRPNEIASSQRTDDGRGFDMGWLGLLGLAGLMGLKRKSSDPALRTDEGNGRAYPSKA
jgi:MYXO-CTERM domain-containing protein